MDHFWQLLFYVAGFLIVAIASTRIARLFLRIKLPLITGLLFMGVVSGPFFINLIPADSVKNLGFINDFSLAYIAFAAGAELYLKELRNRFKSIVWMTFGQLVVTFVLGSLSIYFLADFIPFMTEMGVASKIAIAILGGTIFVARSPSSAIAVINEMRAKGPNTQTALGVTVVKDVLVIILFAICFALSETLITGKELKLGFIAFLLFELALSFGLGFLVGKLLTAILAMTTESYLKTVLILLVGYGVYLISYYCKLWSLDIIGIELYLEPLLICIIGSFVVVNFTAYRLEFTKILNRISNRVYAAFFILTGASMSIDILADVWEIALALFTVRLLAMVLGSVIGGFAGGDPLKTNIIAWMPYVTQAGVGLGLATVIANKYPAWGNQFATILIAVIVLNQVVGPPLFKWFISKVKEGHRRAGVPEFDGIRDAIVIGLENKSVTLARQLHQHGWGVKIATKKQKQDIPNVPDLEIHVIPQKVDLETLEQLDARLAEAVVLLLTDEENYEICELLYEYIGTRDIVVRLNDRKNFDKFHDLGVKIVDPSTAIFNLLFDYVRSPQTTSLLLGMERDQGTIDLEVCDQKLHGTALRDLRLPNDVIILSVTRGDQMIISHGYTVLRLGDIVSLVGSNDSLTKVTILFDK